MNDRLVRTAVPPVFNDNKFKLGFFAANCSGGMAVTQLPERWQNTWENNLKLAKLADAAGIEFMLPIARWIGYGGATDFHGSVLETMTWAAGLLAHTQHINVFATIHTACNHPVVLAKQIATIDQIGRGRAGLNIVCGWNKPEYDAMGQTLPDDHETRYEMGQEWYDIVKKLWYEDERFDWDGKYFKLKGAYGQPHPVSGRVPIFNAAGSAQGRDFATRNADFLFTSAIDLNKSREEIAGIKAQAAARGRNIDVLTFSYVVCRPTVNEAEAYHHYYSQEHADWEAVDNIIRLMFAHAESFPKDQLKLIRDRFSGGHGGFPLIGDPQKVADGLQQLYEAGFSGTTLSFVNYVEEFPYFRDNVLPILEARGLRNAFKVSA